MCDEGCGSAGKNCDKGCDISADMPGGIQGCTTPNCNDECDSQCDCPAGKGFEMGNEANYNGNMWNSPGGGALDYNGNIGGFPDFDPTGTINSDAETYVCVTCPVGRFNAGTTAHQESDGVDMCHEKTPTSCPEGQYLNAGSSSTADDYDCGACADGTYNENNDASTSCPDKLAACPAGERFTASGTSTANNDCTACTGDTYNANDDASTTCPDKLTACSTGQYMVTSGTYTENNHCVDKTPTACGPGQFLITGTSEVQNDYSCDACTSDTYSTDTDASTTCTPKTATCPGGTSMALAADSTADNVCTACPDGQWVAGANNADTSCAVQTQESDCGPGEHWTAAQSDDADNTCQPCPANTYLPGDTPRADKAVWTEVDSTGRWAFPGVTWSFDTDCATGTAECATKHVKKHCSGDTHTTGYVGERPRAPSLLPAAPAARMPPGANPAVRTVATPARLPRRAARTAYGLRPGAAAGSSLPLAAVDPRRRAPRCHGRAQGPAGVLRRRARTGVGVGGRG